MRILCQAKDIGVDGTFKITPKPWRQVMIVSAQVREGIWVPVAFGYLPDKKLDSYTSFRRECVFKKYRPNKIIKPIINYIIT